MIESRENREQLNLRRPPSEVFFEIVIQDLGACLSQQLSPRGRPRHLLCFHEAVFHNMIHHRPHTGYPDSVPVVTSGL